MQIRGDVAKQRRLELGLTQEAAARRAGVSVDTWRRVERHGRCGDLSVGAIAKSVEVGVDQLRESVDRPAQAGSRTTELMCRRCARPVSGHGLRLTLVDRRGGTVRVRAGDDAEELSLWKVANQAGCYCSVECLARNAVDNLFEFTTELPGDAIDLRSKRQ